MTTKPTHARRASAFLRYGASLAAMMSLCAAGGAVAQQAGDDIETVVVTGFRGSLQTSISAKKAETDMVDVIKSEDIGQFPDLNLAESLQRLPGISIDRDGGEGKQITVRGLNSEFSRTRLNGLEALATTGSKDSSGGTNRGRGFDFNVFASDLFSSLTVRKSVSAEVEEGSLGAVIDLQTGRPFDHKGFALAASGQLGYNDLSKKGDYRGTFLISNRWADGRIGALLSVAYGERKVIEENTNTTRWEHAYSQNNIGRFGAFSTDGGNTFTPIPICTNQGATSNNRGRCNTTKVHAQNPAITGEAAAVSDALHPRIPRYNRFETDQKRLGVTGALQIRPNESSLITVEGLYARFDSNRMEHEIEAISFSRGLNGNPQAQIYDYTIENNVITKASFNNVDVRSEHRYDELRTTFGQLNVIWDQTWTDRFSSRFMIGSSKSDQVNPEQTTFTFESYDVQGYSYDYTNMKKPVFNYGISATGKTPDDPGYWTYSTLKTQGDASLIRLRPQSTTNSFSTVRLDFKYEFNDNLTFKFGGSKKTYKHEAEEYGRYTTSVESRNEDADGLIATTINSDIAKYSQTVSTGGNTYLIPNLDLIRSTFDYNCRCVNSYGTFTVNNTNSNSRGNNRWASEDVTASYLQADFRGSIGSIPFRGNVGVRQVDTDLDITGLIGKNSVATVTNVKRSYSDTLPALNLVIEPVQNVFVRFAAAKVMARPTLQSLSPGGTFTTSTQLLQTGNPNLNPVRANTLDLSVEWYVDRDTLFTVAFFQKDIKTYIQNQTLPVVFSDTGLDPAILDGTGLTVNDTFDFRAPVNTPGGKLEGYEISLQKPFTFLPGILSKTGGVINYTNVKSKINYVTASSTNLGTGVSTVTYREENLLGLSPESWNVRVYYEGEAIAGRVSVSYRAGYLSALLPGSGADFWGKNESTNVDAQFTWKINKNLTFIAEGINLTNEPDDRYITYPDAVTTTPLLYDYGHSGRQFYLGLRYKY